MILVAVVALIGICGAVLLITALLGRVLDAVNRWYASIRALLASDPERAMLMWQAPPPHVRAFNWLDERLP